MMIEPLSELINIPEKNKIRLMCGRLINSVADGRPGIKQADMIWLKQSRQNYQDLRRLYTFSKNQKTPPPKLVTSLQEQGLTPSCVTEAEAFIGSELLEALEASFMYLQDVDPQKSRDRLRLDSPEVAKYAAKANIEFLDFFIKMHRKFELKFTEMIELFNQIFNEHLLDEEFATRGIAQFPRGMLAAVGGYLYLYKQDKEGVYKVPTLEQDLYHSVDLIQVKEGKFIYYEIKTAAPKPEVRLVHLRNPKEVVALRDAIATVPLKEEQQRRYHSLDKLLDYSREQTRQGIVNEACWLEIPVN